MTNGNQSNLPNSPSIPGVNNNNNQSSSDPNISNTSGTNLQSRDPNAVPNIIDIAERRRSTRRGRGTSSRRSVVTSQEFSPEPSLQQSNVPDPVPQISSVGRENNGLSRRIGREQRNRLGIGVNNPRERLRNVGRTFRNLGSFSGDRGVEFRTGNQDVDRVGQFFTPQNPVDVALLGLPAPVGRAAGAGLRTAGRGVVSTARSGGARAVGSQFARSAGRTALQTGRATLLGEFALQSSIGISRATEEGEIRDLRNRADFSLANRAGFEGQRPNNIFESIAQEINLGFGRGDDFEAGARQSFIEQGLSPVEAERAAAGLRRERRFRAGGEALSFLSISAATERFGQRELSRAFSGEAQRSRLGRETARRVAPGLFRAGFTEGFSQEVVSQSARDESLSFRNALIGGGIGSVSAASIGTPIATLRPTRPGVSRAIEFGASIADPFEKPGDVIAGGINRAQSRISRSNRFVSPPRTPVINFGVDTVSFSDSLSSLGSVSPSSARNRANSPSSNNIPGRRRSGFGGRTRTFSSPVSLESIVRSNTPPTSPSDTIFGFTPSNTPPTPVPSITVPEIVPPTNTNVNQNVPTNTNTQVPISNLSVNIPTVTPRVRVPPPPLLDFSLGNGSGGRSRRGSFRLFNELDEGLAVFNNLLGGNSLFSQRGGGESMAMRRKKSTRRKSTRRKTSTRRKRRR